MPSSEAELSLLAWVMTTETVHKGTEGTDIDPALKHCQDVAFASEVTGGLWDQKQIVFLVKV